MLDIGALAVDYGIIMGVCMMTLIYMYLLVYRGYSGNLAVDYGISIVQCVMILFYEYFLAYKVLVSGLDSVVAERRSFL